MVSDNGQPEGTDRQSDDQAKQSSLFDPAAEYSALARRKILSDLGSLGGASNAKYVYADNSEEYVAKGPSLVGANFRYVGANEVIAVRLASVLGLPVLDHCLLEQGDDLFFGSLFMDNDTHHDILSKAIFDQCENRDLVYDLVTFDAWILNVDRHERNLIARSTRPGRRRGDNLEGVRHRLLLNDHSHCLMRDAMTPPELATKADHPIDRNIVARIAFVAAEVADASHLSTAIERAESVQKEVIHSIVRSVPEELLPTSERADVARFLVDRNGKLREIIRNERGLFPNLQGGPL